MSADEIVDGFIRETSIHGPLRICSPERKCCARGLWAILFILANGAFIFQAQILVRKYFSYPSNVQTSLEFKMIPFPSVTVCNENPIRLSQIADIEGSDIVLYQIAYKKLLAQDNSIGEDELNVLCNTNPLLSLLCTGLSYQCDACGTNEFQPPENCYSFNDTIGTTSSCDNTTFYDYEIDNSTMFDIFDNLTSSENEKRRKRDTSTDDALSFGQLQLNPKVRSDMNFLLSAIMNSGNQTLIDMYEDAFTNITEFIEDCSYAQKRCNMSTDFVALRNNVYGRCFTFNDITANMSNEDMTVYRAGSGFGLRLRLNVHQSEYLYSTDTTGIRVAVHNKGEWPFPETVGYSAEISVRTSIGITLVETIRLPTPFGNCTDNNDIRSHVPYFYPGNYTTQGCIFSCLALKIAGRCGCIHQNYPKPYGEVTVKIDGNSTTIDSSELPYCNMSTKVCADTAENDLLTSGLISSYTCGCFPSCSEVNYQASISTSTFPSDMYLETANCARSNSSDEPCYTESLYNRLQLEVFYEQLNYQRFEQQEAYSVVQLLSDLGGQLGLWIGASLLSIAEFISFCISITGYGAKISRGDIEMKKSKIGTTTSSTAHMYDHSVMDSDSIVIGPKPA